MKNLFKSMALVAFSSLAVVSCQKSELVSLKTGDLYFSLRTAESKTYIVKDGETYQPYWNKGDKIGVLFEGFDSGKSAPAGRLTNGNDDGTAADFTGTITGAPIEGILYAFYPSDVAKTYADQTAGFDVLNPQHPTATSFDPAADLLISKPVEYLSDDSDVVTNDIYFARALSIFKINIFSTEYADIQGKYLKNLTVSSEGADLAGRPVFDLSAGDAKVTKYNTHVATITAEYESDIVKVGSSKTESGISVFIMASPCTLASGAVLSFSGETEGYTISKDVTLTKDMELAQGKIIEINLSLAEENCTAEQEDLTDYSGIYMIVAENEKDGVTTHYAMPAYTSGNNIKAVVYTLTAEDKAASADEEIDLNDCMCTISKVDEEGAYKGCYTIQDANGLYLYAAGTGTSNNYLKGNATLQNDAKYYWDITCSEEGVYSIVAKSSNNNVLRFNYNNGSPMFSCYAAGKQSPVSLFPFEDVVVDTTPVITVSANEMTITAEGEVAGAGITVKGNKYVTGEIAAAISGDNSGWLTSAAVSEGKLAVTASRNTVPQQRTATITLSYAGAQSVEIAVTQEAAELGSKMTIDFEQETAAYTEWEWNGMTSKQSVTGVVSHSGSYCGTTGSKDPASLTTKAKVDKPQSLTFYVTRQSTNSTASTWKVQVSNNGSSWTDVVSQSATSMDKGTWVEVNADLSSYSDVFVRILYSGSTAVRDIDDVKLVYHTVASLAISGEATKKDYKVGDSFETTGLTVKATYTDGSEKDVTADAEWTVTPAALALETTSVSVVASFGGVSTEPKQIDGIKVTEAAALNSISVKTAPTKVTYKEGEKFDPDGLVITRNYSDATSDDYAYAGHESEFTFSPALDAALASTDTKVTITYKEKSVDQEITVDDTSLKTMDEIFAAATKAGSTATAVKVKFTDCVVTGVNGKNAYLTDANGTKGLIIYDSGHGFAVGDKLNGKVDCKVQLYNGSAELTELKSTTTGLTVTKDGTVTPQTISIANLSGVNTGAVISFSKLSYDGTNFTDGTDNIKPYTTFMALPTFDKAKKYNITGVYIQYNTTKEIAPRTEADIEAIEVPYINATPSKTSVAADGETIEVTVVTNVTTGWTASSNNANFVISDKTDGSFKVVVSKNEDTEKGREATITVKATGATDATFTLTQSKAGGGAEEYKLVSALTDISEGTYCIAALNSSKYYTVPNTTISDQTFTCTEATVTNDVITLPDNAGIFEFISAGTNAFYIYNTNLKKYLVATGSKKFGYVEKDATNYGYWTFSAVTSGGFSGKFSVSHSSNTQYMRAYNYSVRCYNSTSNNGVYLFKKSN